MRCALALLLASTTSCSWVHSAQGGYNPPCKRSYAPPIIDTAIATLASSVCIAGLIASIGEHDSDGFRSSVICYPAMLVAIPAILSAQRGYSGAHTCE